jgi:hypothetical protein
MRHPYVSLAFGLCLVLPGFLWAQQDPYAGTFSGSLQGDPITLELTPAGSGRLTGQMRDSQQTFAVTAETANGAIRGAASETTYGITLDFTGRLSGNALTLTFTVQGMDMEGFDVAFTRSGSTGQQAPPPTGVIVEDGRTRDPALVGTWVNEQIYISGYGDNFMGSTTITRITLAQDGRVFEGASSTTMGGSNYTGQSNGEGAGEVPGVRWYSKDREIWFSVTQDGVTQQARMGRYAVDGPNMLVTADNGEKMLFRRE